MEAVDDLKRKRRRLPLYQGAISLLAVVDSYSNKRLYAK
jgi:hypothetical protein